MASPTRGPIVSGRRPAAALLRGCSFLARRAFGLIEPRACSVAFAAAGLLVGWYGLGAGLVLGFMLDVARNEAKIRRALALYMTGGDRGGAESRVVPRLSSAMPGYAAAACIALRGDWPGTAGAEAGRVLWEKLSSRALEGDDRARREADRVTEVASRCAGADLPGLARLLATTQEASGARRLLADWAFASVALGGGRLDADAELGLRAALGDCGLGAREISAARALSFRGERDPWSVLGLAPGAAPAEVKRAYRALSRAFHPDASRGSDGARFREVQEAYEALSSPPKPGPGA